MKLFSRLLTLLGAPEAPSGKPQQPVLTGRDRRACPRYSVGAPAFLLIEQRRIAASIVDISLGGIQLFLRFEPRDEHLHIELELEHRCVRLVARIVRQRFDSGLFRLGAQFIDVDPQTQEDLRQFIELHVPHRRSIA